MNGDRVMCYVVCLEYCVLLGIRGCDRLDLGAKPKSVFLGLHSLKRGLQIPYFMSLQPGRPSSGHLALLHL